MTFERDDVVIVPFPFTDKTASRRRPALVVSSRANFGAATGQVVLAMITTARSSDWPLDVPLTDPDAAGLRTPCRVRMKLFTLDERLVLRKAGQLAAVDREAVDDALGRLLGR